ncbi:MAG: DUF1643 domain-containing protein [Archangium sp.]
MKRSALIDETGAYRYRLDRELDSGSGRLVFVMLNPSTADGEFDDPTVRKCIGFATRAGFRHLSIVNLYAFRSTHPAGVWRAFLVGTNVVGPATDDVIDDVLSQDGPDRRVTVVVAWGAQQLPDMDERVRRVCALVEKVGRSHTWCLGTTKSGAPRHPLMVPYRQPFERWLPPLENT